nr:hypothetical protein [Paraburkholderia sp. HD33-4]
MGFNVRASRRKAEDPCNYTPEQEDARRTHRELARLSQERIAHMNRIRSLLVLHNVLPQVIIGRDRQLWGGCTLLCRRSQTGVGELPFSSISN